MKRLYIILTVVFALLFSEAYTQNRVATQADVEKYGTYITVGDLILDRPTNPVPFADGINQLRYTTFSKSFPTFREGGTIWIDGDKIGPLCEIRLLNVTETTPWHVKSATIRPIAGTRVNGVYTKNSYGGFLYLFQGLLNLEMNGNSDAYPGLKGLKEGLINFFLIFMFLYLNPFLT